MVTIEDIKNLRGQYDEVSNNPIAVICDYLITQTEVITEAMIDQPEKEPE